MCIEHVPEFLPYLHKGVVRVAIAVKLGQTIANYAANQTRGVRQQSSEMFGITRDGFLASARCKSLDEAQKRG